MYKSFSSLTIASALVATAVSSVAYSQQPTLEYLSETINNVPRVIYVKDLGSSNGIKIVQGQDSCGIRFKAPTQFGSNPPGQFGSIAPSYFGWMAPSKC